jgi:hypothetical protein
MTTPHQEEDNIIKNPYRNKEDIIPSSYIPEYKRLGKDPIIQDFSSLDGEFLASPIIEANVVESHILDNNEHVSYGFGVKPPKTNNTSPNIGEFILMVSGKTISHGSHEYVLSEAKSILYREHPLFLNTKVQLNEIVILKRIGLKIGVFLDE